MANINFKGKQFVQNHHLQVKYHQLEPKKEKSLTDKLSLHDNLIIHGDNLKALKALLPVYASKVKCIYIDPPYNTGTEKWVYNDNVNSPMIQEWMGKIVDDEDLTRHDKWLCMMMPRLKLLRELLTDDGTIFISIDDHEVTHLKMLLDEIFGENNYLAQLTWRQMHTVRNSSKDFNKNTEYILVFAKDKKFLIKEGNPDTYLRYAVDKEDSYPYDDNDDSGPYKLDPLHSRNFYTPYEFTFQKGVKWIAPKGTYPRYSTESLKQMEENNQIVFSNTVLRKADGTHVTYKGNSIVAKRYLKDVQEGVPPDTLLRSELVGFSKDGTAEMMEIFGDKVFDQPKPTNLIKYLLKIGRKVDDKNYIVLDSFAGTGTTGHAVLSLNKEDGGDRKFILIEMEDYADKITAERIKRVIRGVKNSSNQQLQQGLGNHFSYFDLGKPIEVETILSGSNMPSYEELARYVFYTATGEEFDDKMVDEAKGYIGATRNYEVYLLYKPNSEYLKGTALTLDYVEKLGAPNDKKRLIFAPTKYLDQGHLDEHKIDFVQLPFEIYR